MALIKDLKKLVVEDFPSKYRDLVQPLAFVFNPFIESIVNALNKQLNFNDNFNAQETDIEVRLPLNNFNLKHNVRGRVSGVIILRVLNLDNNNDTLTSAPFIQYTPVSEDVIQITNITGLNSNTRYRLRVLILGI
jgi:hypothetical protein